MKTYGVSDPVKAYEILASRFIIENYRLYKKEKKDELGRQFPEFIIDELNLPIYNRKLFFNGEEISIGRSSANSLQNIIDNWNYQFTTNKAAIEGILAAAERRTKQKKKDPLYDLYFKHNALVVLRETYGMQPSAPERIPGFDYPPEHNDFKPTLEEKYYRLVHADMVQKNTLHTLTEEMLEEYLAANIKKLDPDIKIIARQFAVPNGRIDLLGRDTEGNLCIIELKVVDDTDLLWQASYYQAAIRKMYGTSKVRMIVVTKSMPDKLLLPLLNIGNVEVYTFDAVLNKDKITSFSTRKIA
jgi:Holliday junction resolvase-like predicted endonuclease